MRNMFSITTAFAAILLVAGATTRAADYAIDWHTVDGGGQMTTAGGSYELSGTIGQPDARNQRMTGGGFSLTGGFWVIPTCGPHVADFDGDCDVDLGDYQVFESCATGPGFGPPGMDCADADFDQDGDIDHVDFSAFQRCLSGEDVPPRPGCED